MKFGFSALLCFGFQFVAANCDKLDVYMEDAIDYFKVRGASIAFFDKNKHTEPIVRGYGKVKGGSGAM